MMRLTLATLATAVLAAPFSLPADDARWTITPVYMRALDVFHGVGCLAGSSGLVMGAGLRAELLFNGTQLRLTGIAPPRDTQILMDGTPLMPSFAPGAAACVPFAEWARLDERTLHNLTIVAPPTGTGRFQFLIANATGIAPDSDTPGSSSASSTADPASSPGPHPNPLPDSSQPQPQSAADSDSDSDSPSPSPPTRTPHAGLLIAAVLAPLALFLAAGFGIYFFRARLARLKGLTRNKGLALDAQDAKPETDGAAAVGRSRSFKGMCETQFVMVPETVRPDTPGVVKV